jgi:hypothetical protein
VSKHRADTGPLRIARPPRQQLEDRADRWDGPERRHLTRTGELPATVWDQAVVPAPETDPPTGEFSLEDVAAAMGRLPDVLTGPDPEGTGPLPCWHTGEMRILREPVATADPSMWWAWASAGSFFGLFVLAYLLVMFGGA